MDIGDLPKLISRHIRADGDCWIWMAARNKKGYGNCRGRQAHRVVWESLVGKIPEELDLDHCVCLNRACVNPAHLEPVTHAVNTARAAERRTHCLKGLHRLEGDNVILYPEGTSQAGIRRCGACLDEALAADAERKREARAAMPAIPRLRRTRCKRGHEYTEANTFTYPVGSKQAGQRRCLDCDRARRSPAD